jgi:hypothetical protein
MHLKGLRKVADDKEDEDDPALGENDHNEKPFPGGVDAVDRTGARHPCGLPVCGRNLPRRVALSAKPGG